MTEVCFSAGTGSECGVGTVHCWPSAAVHVPDLHSGTETSRAERHPWAIGVTDTRRTETGLITEEHVGFKGFQDLFFSFCNIPLWDIMTHHTDIYSDFFINIGFI